MKTDPGKCSFNNPSFGQNFVLLFFALMQRKVTKEKSRLDFSATHIGSMAK
jgi:hypothetical protein